MSRFQEFCYLVVERQKANKKRKRLLYILNKKLHEAKVYNRHHIKDQYAKEERSTYRNHAETMKEIAKRVYSPLRRELGIMCYYCGNNNVICFTYQGEIYTKQTIENHANNYLFETVVLKDAELINEAYKGLL